MGPRLTPIGACAELAGLAAHEIILGVSPADRHGRLLAKYRRARSEAAARARIVSDIRAAMRDGAASRAADLLIVLRQLLAADASVDLMQGARPNLRRLTPRRRAAGGSPRRGRAAFPSSLGKNHTESVV